MLSRGLQGGGGGGGGGGVDPAACGGCGGCPAMRSVGSRAGVRQTRIHSQLRGHRPRGSIPGQGVVASRASPARVCPAGRLHTLCEGPEVTGTVVAAGLASSEC